MFHGNYHYFFKTCVLSAIEFASTKVRENNVDCSTIELKVRLSPSKKNCCALFFLKIFKFLSQLFGHAGKMAWLERYDRFQILWCHNLVNKELLKHMLSNISQSKNNQTMKFVHLIKHRKINIFLQKLCRKWWGRETSSRCPFGS